MTEQIVARHDPALVARIRRETPLLYEGGADPATERPPHVRAGSSLAALRDPGTGGDRIAVIQDDARFVALIDPGSRRAASLPLPAGRGGHRVFDRAHDNKRFKFDLEACVVVPGEGGERLVAFGSGSTAERDQIVVVSWTGGAEPDIAVYEATAWYDALRAARDFAGSELNVEGAIFLPPDTLRLFQRGNSAPRDGLRPVDATGDLSWSALWAHLQRPAAAPPPAPAAVVQYRLGDLDGVRLTFSDAVAHGETVIFSASAEGSGDAVRDGRVVGSALGVIAAGGARWTRLTDRDGRPFGGKIEGLSLTPGDRWRVSFIVDNDDAEQPSTLYEAALAGPWYPDDR